MFGALSSFEIPMPGARFIGILFVAFAAGCTGWAMQGASSAHSRQLEPLVVAPALLGHARSRPDAGASLPNAIPLMEAPPEATAASPALMACASLANMEQSRTAKPYVARSTNTVLVFRRVLK